MYDVILTARAERELRRLDRSAKNRILPIALALAENPRPHGCLKVKTEESLWRIRVGDWRVGYEIDDEQRVVRIITIGHRREFYN
ncbi:MAG: mRNA interferase RelE/StbE [Pyrinomonadaceae bacterium]|jgi:mRNA interferase RelE/StbE|nr:mRNA interferase RelE/StbE [Pyrinomonadaceae bacterium]